MVLRQQLLSLVAVCRCIHLSDANEPTCCIQFATDEPAGVVNGDCGDDDDDDEADHYGARRASLAPRAMTQRARARRSRRAAVHNGSGGDDNCPPPGERRNVTAFAYPLTVCKPASLCEKASDLVTSERLADFLVEEAAPTSFAPTWRRRRRRRRRHNNHHPYLDAANHYLDCKNSAAAAAAAQSRALSTLPQACCCCLARVGTAISPPVACR